LNREWEITNLKTSFSLEERFIKQKASVLHRGKEGTDNVGEEPLIRDDLSGVESFYRIEKSRREKRRTPVVGPSSVVGKSRWGQRGKVSPREKNRLNSI